MSQEEAPKANGAATEAGDKNAQAKADVNDMLAQLQAKAAATKEADKTEEKTENAKATDDSPSVSKDASRSTETDVESQKQVEKKDEDDSYSSERRNRDKERERDGKPRDRDNFQRGRGGNRGRGNKKWESRNKFDPSTLEESDDPAEIRKQVEFYFSDSNLPLDKFLMAKVGGAENNPVDLETICSFKRMRHFKPHSAVVAALKDSTFVELVDDDTKVKRRVPLSEELADSASHEIVKVFEDRAMPRSIYVKGFGDEFPSTQFDIEAFFAPFGPTNAIRLRRKDHDRSFKGSVFVEFDSEATMEAFMALDPKPEYKSRKLQIMTKKEYCDGKAADIDAGIIRANSPRGTPNKRKYPDDDDWRERRNNDRRGGDSKRGRGRSGGRGFGSKGGRGYGDRNRERETRRRDSPDYEKVKITSPDQENAVPKEKKASIDAAAANADAVAKARAFVEAEKVREGAKAGNTEGNGEANGEGSGAANGGQKRSRDEVEGDAGDDGERAAKKTALTEES